MLRDCGECVAEFSEAGGCNAMTDESLNMEDYIPEGCDSCGDDAMKACMGNKEKYLWNWTKKSVHWIQNFIHFFFLHIKKLFKGSSKINLWTIWHTQFVS